jgi:hypothetical protein
MSGRDGLGVGDGAHNHSARIIHLLDQDIARYRESLTELIKAIDHVLATHTRGEAIICLSRTIVHSVASAHNRQFDDDTLGALAHLAFPLVLMGFDEYDRRNGVRK